MAQFIAPILASFETLLKANLNTKIAALDSNAKIVDATAYSLANKIFPSRYPWVSIFNMGESLADQPETGGSVDLTIPVFVTIDFYGADEVLLHDLADVYNTAVVQSIIGGSGDWCLSGSVELLRIISLETVPIAAEEENELIISGCATRWEATKTVFPLA